MPANHNKTTESSLKQMQVFFYAAVLLCLFSALMLALAYSHEVSTPEPYSGVALNTPASVGVSTTTVHSAKVAAPNPHMPTPVGQAYVVIDVSVRNNNNAAINVIPSADMYIKTSTGTVYYLAPFELSNPFKAGQILPGETTRGQVSFLVPKSATYKFYIEARWTAGAVPFMIQSNDKQLKRGDGAKL